MREAKLYQILLKPYSHNQISYECRKDKKPGTYPRPDVEEHSVIVVTLVRDIPQSTERVREEEDDERLFPDHRWKVLQLLDD